MSDKRKRVSIDVSVNADDATKQLTNLEQRLANMGKKSVDISINIKKGQYTKQINQIKNITKNIQRNLSSVKINVDTDKAKKDIDMFTANLTGTFGKIEKDSKIKVEVDTKQVEEAKRRLLSLKSELGSIKSSLSKIVGIDLDINIDSGELQKVIRGFRNLQEIGTGAAKRISNAFKSVKGSFSGISSGVSGAVGVIKKTLGSLDGVKAGSTFANGLSSSIKSSAGNIGAGLSKSLGAASKAAGVAAGAVAAVGIAVGIAKQAYKITKAISGPINDAIKKDYTINLKVRGLEGSLINSQIDSKGMGKELTAVTKKFVDSYLTFRDSLKNTGKVIAQATRYVMQGGDKNSTRLGISNKKLRELVQTGDKYLGKWKEIYGKIKDSEKPFRTLGNMGFNKAGDKLASSLVKSISQFNKLKKTSDKVFAGMKVAAKAAGFGITKALQGAFNAIPIVGKFIGGFVKAATSFVKVGIRFATNIIKGITGFVRGFINAGKKIVSFIARGIGGVIKLGVNIVKGIVKGIKSVIMLPINAGKLIVNSLKKGINLVLTPIKFGVNLARGIIKGITSVVSGFIKVGKTIGTAIIRGITGTLRFVGAFAKTFINIGINISKAIARGIKSGLGFVTNSIKALTKAVMSPIKLMGKTISSTIGTAFSISRSVMGGIGNTIMEALDGDHTIELELVPSTGNILTSLIDKRDVTNQLKRDLSVITATMPKELGQVTNAFGAKILDAGQKVQRYANLMLQAYDFVRNNKGVITSTFQKLYNTMAPVAKRIMGDLGIVLRDYGQKAMGALRAKMLEKVSPVIEPFKNVLSVIKDEFLNIRESLSGFSGQLRDVVGVFKSRIRDIIDNLVILAADIQGRFTQIVDSFIGVADAARVSFKDILGNLGGVVEVIKSKMGDSASVISLAVEFFKNKFHEVANGIEGKFDGVINVIKTNLPKIMQALTNLMGVVVQNVKVALDKVIDAFNKLKPVVVSAADKVKEFVANISVDDIKKKFNELKTSLTKLIGKIKTFMEVMMYVASFLVGWFYPVTAPIIALVGAAYLLVKAFHFMHGVMSKFSGFMSSGFRNIFNKVKDYWDKKTGNYDYDSRKRDIENNSKYELRSTKERVGQYLIKGDLGLNRGNEKANKLLERHNKLRFQYIDQEIKIRELASKGRNTAGAYEKLKDLDLKLFETDNELMRYFRASTRDIFGFTKDMGTEEANDEMDGLKKSIEEAEKAAKDFEQTKNQSFDFAGVKKSFDDLVKQMQDSSDEFKESFTGDSNQNKGNNRGKDFPKDNPNKYKDEAKKFARQSEDALKDFKKSLEDIFKSEPMQNIKNDVKETFNGEEVQQFKQTLAEAFDSSSIENVKEAIGKAFDKETTDKIKQTVTGSFDNEFTQALKERIVKAAEEAKKAATTVATDEEVGQAKSNLKDVGNSIRKKVEVTAETRLLQQKLDSTFQSMRHPVNALKEYISAKLGKVHINLTVKGEQQAKKAVENVYKAMERFKSAKGSEKLTAGIDVAIQSIKYKLITLKNTMKENFVSNLINKMSGKAKKASKELAENVPGGSKTIGFFKTSLGKLSLLLGGFGIGSYIKQSTELAIQFEASAMQIQRSLGSASQKIMDFAQNSAAALGISQTQTMEYGNKFSLMVRQFETDTDKIANTTNALMQAAAITASATGTELSTVMDSFQSALTGSSEAVDQYGLNMKIANLEARLGIDNWNDLTVAQQQYYITQELINQTTANFGNKTLKNTNSMLAQFKAQLSNTSLALGKAFKAILTVVLPYLTAFMKALENVFNYIATLITSILSLFGITVDFASSASNNIEAVGGDIDTSGLDGVSEGMDGAAESADNAADSVEKMKGSLAGFDELNTLSFTDESGSDGAGDIPAGGIDTSALDSGLAELGETDSALDKLQEKFKGFFDWIKKLIERIKELAKLFKEGFDLSFDYSKLKDIWESLKSIGESLKYIFFNEEVAAALDNLANKFAFAMGQIVGAIANIGASIIQMFLGGIAKSLDENKDWIKEKLITCIDVTGEIWTLLGNFAQALSEIFGVLGEEEGQGIIANIVSGLTYAFGTHAEIMLKLGRDIVDLITGPIVDNVESIKENFKSFLGTIESITGTIKDSIKSVCDTISQTYDEKISPTLKLLRDGFSDTMAKFQEVYAEYIQPVLDALAERFDDVMKRYITPALNNLVSLFGTVIEVLGILYETILKPLIDFIVQVIVPTAMPLLESAFNVIITVVGLVIGIIGDLLGVLDGFLTFLVGVFQGDWEKAWGGLQKCSENFFKIFTDLWEGLKSILLDGKFFEALKNFFKGTLEWIKGRFEWFRDKVGDTAEEAWEFIKKPFELMGQWFKDTFAKAYDLATGTWNNIKTWASEIPTKIANGLSNLVSTMSSKFSSAWTACKNAFSGVATWASGLASTIGDKFRNLGSTVGEAIGGAIKTAINGVISTIERTINGAIGLINGAINLINKIPGVSISSISSVSLPRLANGGLVTSSTLANIGEAGPEAVIPLNRSSLWAPQLASELAKQLSVSGINQSNTSSRPLEVKLIVDGRELGRASINNINKLQRESNEILLDI